MKKLIQAENMIRLLKLVKYNRTKELFCYLFRIMVFLNHIKKI